MLIALLAVLGVNLIVIVLLLVALLLRRRRVSRRAGAFRGAIRVLDGEVEGLAPKWKRGYGRWVSHDVLVWTKAPLLVQTEEVKVDGLGERRPARPDEVKRLGDHPIVVGVKTDRATAEVAAGGDDSELLLGPYGKPVDASVGAASTPTGPEASDHDLNPRGTRSGSQ